MSELKTIMYRAISLLHHRNFITELELTDEIRHGLYAAMKGYGLSFRSCSHGDWSWIELCGSEGGSALDDKAILSRPFNMAGFTEADKKFQEYLGSIAVIREETHEEIEDASEYGWLSPTGEFFPGEWGTHEEIATNIISDKGWADEFWNYPNEPLGTTSGDYLCHVKGWVLVHCPARFGHVQVQQGKRLTKKQREFLYNYFNAQGERLRANDYLAE